MNFDFLNVFGGILLFIFIVALLAQVPLWMWIIIIPIMVLIGTFKNAK